MAVIFEKDASPDVRIMERFNRLFAETPVVVRSPGRVNLIGEHTDYNRGFVLPAAIDKAIYMAVSRRDDLEMHLMSADLETNYQCAVNRVIPSPIGWPDYILGVVAQLQHRGLVIGGFNCVFGGDIPLGAGMSSSAALECATIYALNEIFGLGLDQLTMVKLAQRAENEFVGVKCGIMDQFASMFGRKHSVIRLDCQSLAYEYVPFNAAGVRIVLFDTNVKHSLASSAYNERRAQCEKGVSMVKAGIGGSGVSGDGIESLRDVSLDMLDQFVASADPLVYRRCRYVVGENARLLAACDDLQKGDIGSFGQRMFATHEGLSKDYEVSCTELDFLVNAVKGQPGVLGARMMGGGFGGCTINLVRGEAVGELAANVSAAYTKAMNRELTTYQSQIENGTSLL